MAINTPKVIAGGLAAGVVLNVLDFLLNNVVLASQMEAALNALNPSLADNMQGGSVIAMFVVLDLLFGVLLVWTYAAMRPRFGAGAKTAAIAAAQVWLVGGVIYAFMVAMGMFTWGFFLLGSIASLVNLMVSTQVGAMLYKEEAAAGS
jgi:hypothetical protein